MPTLIPSIRAEMGNRTYFIGKMRARDICQQVGIAAELEEWDRLTIEELYQRDLNRRRVEREIAPYLVNTSDRFFGSIIVLVNDPSSIEFETISDFGAKLPKSYELASSDIGFLTVGAGSHSSASGALVALDGQHRLAALRLTVQGASLRGPYIDDVANDEVTAIFVVNHSEVESRRLFTTLNRSARKVGRNDLLLMSEDDARSVIARRLISKPLLAPRGLEQSPMVKWTGNTISASDTAVTTLNALNDAVGIVAESIAAPFALRKEYSIRPPDSELDPVEAEVELWLTAVFESLPQLAEIREAPGEVVAAREPDAPISTILRPAGFVVLFRAIAAAIDPDRGAMKSVPEALRALSGIDWRLSAPHWTGVLVTPGGRISGRRNEWNLAADFVAAAAATTTAKDYFTTDVRDRYRSHIGDSTAQLPSAFKGSK